MKQLHTTPELRIELLGPVCVRCADHVLGGLGGRRTQELLCYLLIHSARPIRREVLAERLWGEADEPHPRKQLRQALWLLQHALDDAGAPDILKVGAEWIEMQRSVSMWTDVWALEDAFRASCGNSADLLTIAKAREAVELYRGDLLDGCYLTWCLMERERCRTMYIALLDRLLSVAVASSDLAAGMAYGTAILREDRAHERTHQQLMQLMVDQGDRTGALRQYEACRRALDEELGVEPALTTKVLRESLCGEDLDRIAPFVLEAHSTSVLDELTVTLDRAQALVRTEIARRDSR